jgi:hypothetical protein
MGAAADRLWTCGQRKRVAHRVHSSQQQTQKIATASIRSKETRNLAVRSHAVPNCQQNAHRFLRGGNKKKLKFLEIEAPQLPRVLDDVELAQVSISYLIAAGGDPESLLAADGFGDPRYALQFVARTDKKDDERLARFISIYRSDEVKQYIKSRYGRFFVPVW